MMKYLLGLDIGTSATKTVLFDETMKVIASASEEYPMYQPQNGWAEQNPKDWYNASLHTIQEVLVKSKINPEDVKGIGLSGQMHGLVMLDENNEVIRPSIIWCDQRTVKECEEITAKVGAERLIEITANPALTGFTASKILWVRNNEPENYARCKHILLPKDYVRFCMTGEYATPEVTGRINDEFAKLSGLSTDTVVVGGAGDNAAAAIGTGIVKDGKAFTTIGTSGVVFAHTDKLSIDPKGRVHTFCCAVPGCWHVMGVTLAAGLSLKWFRDNIADNYKAKAEELGKDPYVLMNEAVAKIPCGSDRLMYLPYLMGERTPHLDPNCRGVFFGLSAIHTKENMMRAVMEGVAYSLSDCYDILKEMGVTVDEMMACGGGGKSPVWRQMLADMFECEVKTLTSEEGPALGVAILAGVGAGIFKDVVSACDEFIKTGTNCSEIKEESEYYKQGHALYKKVYAQLKGCYQDLAKL